MILILLCASLTVTQGLNSDPNIDHTMDSASEMFLCVICRIFFLLDKPQYTKGPCVRTLEHFSSGSLCPPSAVK